MKESKWLVKEQPSELVEEISTACGISRLVASLLINRKLTTKTAVESFLSKSIDGLFNPFLLPDMDKAVNRIKKAVNGKEHITIYGDYDVDGITSVSMLVLYFRSQGLKADFYIPDRTEEGYGINQNALEKIRSNGTTLLITVDSGITAINEARFAKELGLDLIITDHHECKDELPECIAVVNPKRPDSIYPFKELAGAGVAFKLICALEDNDKLCNVIDLYSEFACLGTVADVMPLVSENRIITAAGLDRINKGSRNYGIRALIEASGIDMSKKATSTTLSFTLAPRINAAGRLGDAGRAVNMFLEDGYKRALDIANELCYENRERQNAENEIMERAVKLIDDEYDLKKDRILVLGCDGWHNGIIGIVASRLIDRYYLPCILISFDGKTGKGSGRSIKGLNLFSALEDSKDLLDKYGGHELAAGLTINRDNLEAFKERIKRYASENLPPEALEPVREIDAVIKPEDINIKTANELSLLEPFGMGNPTPLLLLKGAVIEDIMGLGKDKHIKLTLRAGDSSITALYFGMSPANFEYTCKDSINILCSLDINRFRGNETVQLIIRDVKPCGVQMADAFKNEYEYYLENRKFPLPAGAIPSREEMGAVYLYFFRKKISDQEEYLPSVLCRSISFEQKVVINYSKLMFSLNIMEELGLLTVTRRDDYISVKLKDESKKVQLSNSKLWMSLTG